MQGIGKQNSIISSFPEELGELSVQAGFPSYRGTQLFNWIHKKGVMELERMGNLPAAFRSVIANYGDICAVKKGAVFTSSDGTRKIEVQLGDGNIVETVLIPEEGKLTQCVSSQVGCAVGCVFCRSGKYGLVRNLSAGEIISQIFIARSAYQKDEKLRNVVLMGVGEPLHNVDNVVRALGLLSHPDGLCLSSRRVTLSTVGIIRGIERLAKATGGKTALAVSLHAADDQIRSMLVPGVSSSIDEIIQALKAYPLPARRRFTIEYVLLKGINDRDSDARKLAKILAPIKVKVNLLPLNPHDLTEYEAPSPQRVQAFQNILVNKGISVFMRKKRGDDINAACGQLLATSTGAKACSNGTETKE